MTVSINRDRGGRTAMTAGRLTIRRRPESGSRRVLDTTWRPLLAIEAVGSDRITVERQRLSLGREVSSSAGATLLSVLAHVACLVAVTLFLQNRPTPPDMPGTTQVAMVFQPAPATVPAVPATPAATPVVVPRPPEPPAEAAALTSEPPAPPAPVRPPTAAAPEPPAPPPVPTETTALPVAPVHLARVVPKPSRPPRTPPAKRQAVAHPYSAPGEKRASQASPPSPAPAQSEELAASRPAAAGPLIPPRPVAGMETNRAPAYPEIALRRGESGRVMLRVSVSAHGSPLEVAVAQSSGYTVLDEAALAAVRQWQFIPATQAGIPVAAIADVPVRFRIDN